MKVSFFVTCLIDLFFPATGESVVDLLEAQGVDVEFRAAQQCCGRLALEAGFTDDAVAQARQHIGPRDRYGTAEFGALDNLRERLKYGERLALVCWCSPQACHADVLKELLEGPR